MQVGGWFDVRVLWLRAGEEFVSRGADFVFIVPTGALVDRLEFEEVFEGEACAVEFHLFAIECKTIAGESEIFSAI